MKLGILTYLQRPGFGCVNTYFEHVQECPPKNELLMYSFHDWGKDVFRISLDPDKPEVGLINAMNHDTPPTPKTYAISNAVFFCGLRLAQQRGFTHVLYAETDCRFARPHWDEEVFAEFFMLEGFVKTLGLAKSLVAAGTLVCKNPCNFNLEAAKRWQRLVSTSGKHVPVATYGWKASNQKENPCIFPNGALGIYNVEAMAELFDLTQTIPLALKIHPYDMQIGMNLWEKIGIKTFDVLAHLETIYSGFGDILTTPEQRKDLLTSGKVAAIHQIKDSWKPPQKGL